MLKPYHLLLTLLLLIIGQFNATASELLTAIHSENNGNIVVKIVIPDQPRYEEGAPVVIDVANWFVNPSGFHEAIDATPSGIYTISYLWPGLSDPFTGTKSEGTYDYGGPLSLQALSDVIRFATGLIPDTSGNLLNELVSPTPLLDNVGLFASSHAGVVGTNVIAHFGDEFPDLKYFIGRENPTRDEMYALEIGYFSDQRDKILNGFYNEAAYSDTGISIDYSTMGWYDDGVSMARPMHQASDSTDEHTLHYQIHPTIYNKRMYSRGILQALLDNGALTLENWPEDLGTPAQAHEWWPFRITVHNYPKLLETAPELKVMLVFCEQDHVQAAPTKPHVHQAWDGFHHRANLWVRMNPDRSYAQSVFPDFGLDYPDNLANEEPADWKNINNWGFPTPRGANFSREDIWLAAICEMADRVLEDKWHPDLLREFYPVYVDTNDTGIAKQKRLDNTFNLLSVYPNPFNPQTKIFLKLGQQSDIQINIYNLKGEKVQSIYQGTKSRGNHEFSWNASAHPSGTYLIQAISDHQIQSQKCILFK